MTTRRTTTMPTTTQARPTTAQTIGQTIGQTRVETTARPTTAASATPRPVRRVTAVLEQDLRCGCGQELDCCAGDHCPRCGHDLRHQQ